MKLVLQMLEINPYYRPTAQQLLENKVFDSIRMPMIECIETKYKYKVIVDSNQYKYDYENDCYPEGEAKTMETILRSIVEETMKFSGSHKHK